MSIPNILVPTTNKVTNGACLQYTMTDLILKGKGLPNWRLKFGEVDSTGHRKALVISLWLSQVCTHMLSIACIQNTKTMPMNMKYRKSH